MTTTSTGRRRHRASSTPHQPPTSIRSSSASPQSAGCAFRRCAGTRIFDLRRLLAVHEPRRINHPAARRNLAAVTQRTASQSTSSPPKRRWLNWEGHHTTGVHQPPETAPTQRVTNTPPGRDRGVAPAQAAERRTTLRLRRAMEIAGHRTDAPPTRPSINRGECVCRAIRGQRSGSRAGRDQRLRVRTPPGTDAAGSPTGAPKRAQPRPTNLANRAHDARAGSRDDATGDKPPVRPPVSR